MCRIDDTFLCCNRWAGQKAKGKEKMLAEQDKLRAVWTAVDTDGEKFRHLHQSPSSELRRGHCPGFSDDFQSLGDWFGTRSAGTRRCRPHNHR